MGAVSGEPLGSLGVRQLHVVASPFWFFILYVAGVMAEATETTFVGVLDEPMPLGMPRQIPDLHVFKIKPTVGAGGRFIFVRLIS